MTYNQTIDVHITNNFENFKFDVFIFEVDEESGKIICRSVIRAATEPGSANLRIDPIEPLPPPDPVLDEMMTAADFQAPFSGDKKKVPVDSIPSTTDTLNWREMERSKQAEYQKNLRSSIYG